MSNWNDKENGGNMTLSITQAHEGYRSLRIEAISEDELIKILTSTETDLPASVNFEFWSYFSPTSGNTAQMSMFFRYQDTDNFYVSDLYHSYGAPPKLYLNFRKRVAGVYTDVGATNLGDKLNQWLHFKIQFCEIEGIIYCDEFLEETNKWVPKKNSTLSKHWNNGAVGVGAVPSGNVIGGYAYLDDTTIYY